jgi:hypothetical protein
MPAQNCLHKRNNSAVPHFRRAVPIDLRDAFGCRELTGSLQTRSLAEARRRRNALVAATDALFECARAMQSKGTADRTSLLNAFQRQRQQLLGGSAPLSATPNAEHPSCPSEEPNEGYWPSEYDEVFCEGDIRPEIRPDFVLTPSMVPKLLARRRALILQGDDILRPMDSRADLQGMRDGLAELKDEIRDDIVRGDTSNVREEALTMLAYEGIDLSKTSIKHLGDYLTRFLDSELALIKEQLERLNGARIPTPELPEERLDTDDWEAFIENWEDVRKPTGGSVKSVRTELARFRKFTEDKNPVDVTLDDIHKFADFLRESVSRSRVKTIIALLRPLIGVAIESRITSLKHNVFSDFSLEVSEKEINSYQPFSPRQLQSFFDAPVHRQGVRPAKGGKEAAFWLPMLALFEGLRLEESGSLTCDSIFQKCGRFWLKVGESKNHNSSYREVPLHGEILNHGFLKYVEDQRTQHGYRASLFTGLKVKNIDEKKTRMFSTWVNEYIDEHVIDHRQYTFHSFRNNFEDGLTSGSVQEDVRRALMGQALGGMTRRYGQKNRANRRVFPDKVLIEAIDALHYDGLDLSRISRSAQPSF